MLAGGGPTMIVAALRAVEKEANRKMHVKMKLAKFLPENKE